jgi:GNAT superfamily N-acetyltransferase
MLQLEQVATDRHRDHVRTLHTEFLQWACERCREEIGFSFDALAAVERDMASLGNYLPPEGGLLLAYDAGELAGCASMRRIGPAVAEVKRMYVRPAYRQRGIGRALLAGTVDAARRAGYTTLRLDTPVFLPAQRLYESFGFRDIAPYEESEVPPRYRTHWRFMEIALQPVPPSTAGG